MRYRSFGHYVSLAREQRGYSMRQLATRIGVAPSVISRLEGGRPSLPHPDLVVALVKQLGLDMRITLGLLPGYQRLCNQVTQDTTNDTRK
jgi:transcriptional regulator with XRE-family HTH domain